MTEKRKVVFHNVVAFWWKSSPGRGCGVRGTQRHGAGRCGAGAGLLGLVWCGSAGDDGTLTLGENTNVQDNAVLHCDPGGAVTLGKNVTVGHCALVHGCTVGDGSLIGMHATLLNHCVVGKNCIIGAGALVPEGKIIPDDSLVVGVPGKIIKQVSPEQAAASLANAAHYVGEGRRHAAALRKEEKGENE